MPKRPPKPCNKPACREYATKGSYCDAHQPKAWASNEGLSRHQRGYGSQWEKIRERALKRDGYLCQVCLDKGIFTQAQAVDHIKAKTDGGTDDLDNLQSICNPCHEAKTVEEANNGRNK